jgi:hypothetical protein
MITTEYLMLTELINKQLSWNRTIANKFHRYAFVNTGDEGETMWEQNANGVFIWRHKTAHFFHNDGRIYKISRVWNENDWDLHCKLHNRILIYNDCRIETPIHKEIIDNEHGSWYYTIIARPNAELGVDMFQDILTNIVNTDYIIARVEQITALIKHLNQVSTLFPNVMPKLTRDSHGFFFSDIKEWTLHPKIFTSNCLTRIYRNMIILDTMYGIKIDKNRVLTKARSEWNL